MNNKCEYFRAIIKNKTMYTIGNNCRKYDDLDINNCINKMLLNCKGVIINKEGGVIMAEGVDGRNIWMISNRQPWVEALVRGYITSKTRSAAVYLPKSGDTVFLHASKALWACYKDLPWTKDIDVKNLPRGGVVAVAKVKGVVDRDFMPKSDRPYFMVRESDGYEWNCADHRVVIFEDIKPIEFLPCRGAQVPVKKLPQELMDYAAKKGMLKIVENQEKCWLYGDNDPDITINVECETPGGKSCPPKDVKVHNSCYMDIDA